ncbi:MAG: ACT domain-containing protein [Thermodesulfovibrionales bacterium]|nr:ACT domain-containing protein [Thermodesulfovibrionales bacterium]
MAGIREISVFAENKPGKIEKITAVLANEGINILAITIASTNGFGIIKFIVDKTDLAYQKLKEKGFTVSLNEVLAFEMKDRPGQIHEIAKTLTKLEINMENAYVFVEDSRKKAYFIVQVKDMERAKRLLQKENLKLYDENKEVK